MARRPKTTEETWYDVFTDWTLEDQAAALKVLGALHRQKQREKKPDPRTDQVTFEPSIPEQRAMGIDR